MHELVQEHILPIFRQLPRPLRDAVISIDNFGLMTILTKEGPPSFNWEMKPISPEKTHSIARITKILAEATEQLSKIQLPGIIVLDLYCDWPVIQYIEDIDTVIKHAAWAKPLAAVLVPDRKIDGDVAICSIGVISGQRYSDLQGPVPAWKLIDGTWVDIPILTESQVAR